MKKLLELEQRIGYKFENFDLLVKAMTHSSYANEHRYEKKENNERLEFLGDAVLELISSDYLFAKDLNPCTSMLFKYIGHPYS